MNHDVVVSYKSEQAQYAGEIVRLLEENGVRCWIAPRNIPCGYGYPDVIIPAIRSAKGLVLVLSSAAQKSPHVNSEVDRAFSNGCQIFPFQIDDSPLSDSMQYYLNRSQITNNLHELIQSVRSTIHYTSAARIIKTLDEANIDYTIDNDGNFWTCHSFTYKGKAYRVSIITHAHTFLSQNGQVEGRHVSGRFGFKVARRVLEKVLVHFGDSSRWQIKGNERQGYEVVYTAGIPVSLNGQEVCNLYEEIVELYRQVTIAIDKYEEDDGKGGWGTAIATGIGILAGIAGIAIATNSNDAPDEK